MARILVVDDHPLIRRGLARVLKEKLPDSIVTEAGNALETLAAIRDRSSDLVILDLSLPDTSGLELLKEIREEHPRVPVLILSMHPEEQFATRVLRAGAAGYLTKGSSSEVLIQAVQRVLAGGKFVSAETAERLAGELMMDTSKPLHEQLSDREYDTMLRLASGQSITEIAATLNLSVKTVSTYRTRVLLKMGKHNNSELTQYALRNKLIE